MIDLRPVGYVIGLLVSTLGAAMTVPAAADLVTGSGNWIGVAAAAAVTLFTGIGFALSCRGPRLGALSLQQIFLLTTLVWVVLPVFGSLPFVFGAPHARYVDAYFEAMSGMTTTGSTVFTGLDSMPNGALLWRALLQWFGGVGVIVVAMAFLPALRVGGMQLFKSEAFDTFGKVLPRAREIAASVSWIYVSMTLACAIAYAALGMDLFDAVSHAMTTVSTGGFANYDASIGHFPPAVEYVSTVFLLASALPFVRYVQLAAGSARPLFRDEQVRGFVGLYVVIVAILVAWRWWTGEEDLEKNLREVLFNVASILTGAGFASEDYGSWGDFSVAMFFIMGMIGGCAGSTCCAIKVFRFQVLAAALWSQVRAIHSPSGVFTPRFAGRPIPEDAISSVMTFFYMFALTLGVVAVALSMMGLDSMTAISGAATALANVGPGLGPEIGPTGNFAGLPDAAKWLLAAAMVVGRLEILSVFVIFTIAFWRE